MEEVLYPLTVHFAFGNKRYYFGSHQINFILILLFQMHTKWILGTFIRINIVWNLFGKYRHHSQGDDGQCTCCRKMNGICGGRHFTWAHDSLYICGYECPEVWFISVNDLRPMWRLARGQGDRTPRVDGHSVPGDHRTFPRIEMPLLLPSNVK